MKYNSLRNIIGIVICLIIIFSILYSYLYSPSKNQLYIIEALQNMDASYLYHDDNTGKMSFHDKIKTPDDADLSNILMNDDYYNTTLFESSLPIYDDNQIDKDIKYFNNTSHILMNYYKMGMYE